MSSWRGRDTSVRLGRGEEDDELALPMIPPKLPPAVSGSTSLNPHAVKLPAFMSWQNF
jgi:hypothetical protein